MDAIPQITAPWITAGATLVGVVVGALVSVGTTWWTQKSQRRRSADFVCVLVVGHLDRLTYDCLAIAEDDGIVSDEYGMRYEITSQYPSFDPLSFDVDWKALDTKLAFEIVQIPHRIERLKSKASEVYDPHDSDYYVRTRQRLFMEFGEQISHLSAKVRKAGKLPPDPEWKRKTVDFARVQKVYQEEEKKRFVNQARFQALQRSQGTSS